MHELSPMMTDCSDLARSYFIARLMGIRIGILDEPEQQPFETELVKDVITLMTVFCARLYGKRSWKNKVKENTGIKNLSFR